MPQDTFNSLQDCFTWMESLPDDEVDAQLPLKTLAHAVRVMRAYKQRPSRTSRNELQKLAKTWHIQQKANGTKMNISNLCKTLLAHIIKEASRLKMLRDSAHLRPMSFASSALYVAFQRG